MRRPCATCPGRAGGAWGDARERPLGEAGAHIGAVCGSFLHLIDRTTERTDDLGRTRHLRLVQS